MVKGVAFQQLHGDKRLGLALELYFLNRVDRTDVGMVERRGGTRLQQKTVQRILIAGKLRRQELQRNPAPQVEVLRFVNNSHAAAAKLTGDAVVRDGLANHGNRQGNSS